MTADNAANNGTLMRRFVRLLQPYITEDMDDLDALKAFIQCLSHIIHLSVMALLLGLKAVPYDIPLDQLDDGGLTEAEAETLASENSDSIDRDDALMRVELDIDLTSAVQKVSTVQRGVS